MTIFKPASKEDIKQRKAQRINIWIKEFLERPDVTKNTDGSYDVDRYVDLRNMNLTKLPLKFGKVTGGFFAIIINSLH